MYPKVKELIIDCELEDQVDNIKWLPIFNKEETAIAIAKLFINAKAAIGLSIPDRQQSKENADKFYNDISKQIHIFAKIEGRARLGYTNEDITSLFCHIALGGERYKKL
jgi:hypothetical protein